MRPDLAKRFKPKPGQTINPDRQLCVVRVSPDGRLLVAGGTDGTIRRWDLSKPDRPELEAIKGHHGFVSGLAFHPDGARLFSADSWGGVACRSIKAGAPTLEWSVENAHDGWARDLAISPDGRLLATCGRDGKVSLRSTKDGAIARETAGHAADVFCVAFHPSGRFVVSGDLFGGIKTWDVETGAVGRVFDPKSLHRLDRLQDVGGARLLRFDPAGKELIVGGAEPKNGGNVQGVPTLLRFDWETGRLLSKRSVGGDGDGFFYDLVRHPAGFYLGVTSGNPGAGKLVAWDLDDETPFFQDARSPNCHSLALSPDSRLLVVSATNGGSNGNGRKIGGGKEYPGNRSPLVFWDLPELTNSEPPLEKKPPVKDGKS